MDNNRRTLLATGAAAAVVAAAPNAFAQAKPGQGGGMSIYQKGDVRIHYEDTGGSGFPLLIIPGGGLNSTIGFLAGAAPFNAIEEFKNEYRCIAADLRNAPGGQSSGPLEVERPWDSHADDQLGLMDHLGIKQFIALGYCIGGPMIWNLIKRAPDRVVAGVLAQPVGSRPEARDFFYEGNLKSWAPEIMKRRPELTMETIDRFLTKCTAPTPISCSPSRATSCAVAGRRCWCCPTTCRRTPMRWRWNRRCSPPTPKSACFRGRNRKSAFRSRCARSARS